MSATRLGVGSFGRTLLFGTGAALALLASWPLLGSAAWLSLFLVGTAVVYAAGLAPTRRAQLRVGALAVGLGALVLLLARGPGEAALGAALALALCRSGPAFSLAHSVRLRLTARRATRGLPTWPHPARAFVTELALLGAGLALARFVCGWHPASWALALWSFFVIQSVYFLVGGVRLRAPAEPGDPFDRARARLESLLAEWGV